MIKVYGIKMDKEMDRDTYDSLTAHISKEKQERIKRFKFFADAQRGLVGELLARYGLCKRLNVDNHQLHFEKNDFGKPYLIDHEDIDFNISHSGDWVLCAVSDHPVGVDVEVIKPIDIKIAKRFFAEEEYKDLLEKQDDEQMPYFYRLWTLKESYIKAMGKGMSIPLDSFSFQINGEEIGITEPKGDEYSLKQFQVDEKHMVAVCGVGCLEIGDMEVVELGELEAFFK